MQTKPRPANIGLPQWGLTCFYDALVLKRSAELRLNISAKIPHCGKPKNVTCYYRTTHPKQTMGLFDKIFRRNTNPIFEAEKLPSFWEDDYCQIEIVPRKNIEHIEKSIKQIEEFTEKTRTEYGFTDIFMREDLPYPTINEELRADYFEKLMTEKGFGKAMKIRYDGYTIIDCSKTTSNGFSLPCFNFFYDCNDEYINNIWISTSLITSNDHFNKILEALYELGESCELLLINWNSSELIDLADRNQIKEYLMSYWK